MISSFVIENYDCPQRQFIRSRCFLRFYNKDVKMNIFVLLPITPNVELTCFKHKRHETATIQQHFSADTGTVMPDATRNMQYI